eukprot:664646-Pyramimonas_sp.AAC.1
MPVSGSEASSPRGGHVHPRRAAKRPGQGATSVREQRAWGAAPARVPCTPSEMHLEGPTRMTFV